METTKINKEMWIIDTDPGCDDLMCLLYMLNKKDIDIKMISLVEGNTSIENVCNNMRKIVKLTHRNDIPIYKGCLPLLRGSGNAERVHGDDGLGNIEYFNTLEYDDIKLQEGNAALKMVELFETYPGQINLFMIGPLTNLAVAYLINPNIVNLVKSFYIMGGAHSSKGNICCAGEFNFTYDCIAPKVVLPFFKNVIMVPWEPIEHHIFVHNDFLIIKDNLAKSERKYNIDIFDVTEKLFISFTERRGGLMICDLYAAMCIFNPNTVKNCFLARCDPTIDSENLVGCLTVKSKIKHKVKNYVSGLEELKKLNQPGLQLIVELMDREVIMAELHNIYYHS